MKTMASADSLAITLSAVIAIIEDAAAGNRRERFRHTGTMDPEDPEAAAARRDRRPPRRRGITEAPTDFGNLRNGCLHRRPDFGTLHEDTVAPLRPLNDNRFLVAVPDENTWSGLDAGHGTDYDPIDPIADPEDDAADITVIHRVGSRPCTLSCEYASSFGPMIPVRAFEVPSLREAPNHQVIQ